MWPTVVLVTERFRSGHVSFTQPKWSQKTRSFQSNRQKRKAQRTVENPGKMQQYAPPPPSPTEAPPIATPAAPMARHAGPVDWPTLNGVVLNCMRSCQQPTGIESAVNSLGLSGVVYAEVNMVHCIVLSETVTRFKVRVPTIFRKAVWLLLHRKLTREFPVDVRYAVTYPVEGIPARVCMMCTCSWLIRHTNEQVYYLGVVSTCPCDCWMVFEQSSPIGSFTKNRANIVVHGTVYTL